jgi:hypothetical protein
VVSNTKGNGARYARADIRYDVERGLLELREVEEGDELEGAGGERRKSQPLAQG